jgi:histidinol dehydrogenase
MRPEPGGASGDRTARVARIVNDVRRRGDEAIVEYTKQYDRASMSIDQLRVPDSVLARARSLVEPDVIDAFEVMTERLRRTSERQLPTSWIERQGEEAVGELVRPLWRVGVYAGGSTAAYASSVIMATTPARVAGVGGIAVCSPPRRDREIAGPVLAACAVAGVDEVYRIGGAQAIAALAYGTNSVRPVQKIVGAGGPYVRLAKQAVAGDVGIDSGAGPSEVAIVADESASVEMVAADIIAGAEHGAHGTYALVTWVPQLAEEVAKLLEVEMTRHERAEDLENALIEGAVAVLVRDRRHAIDTVNAFAPEHLELAFDGAWDSLDLIQSAGAVFVGTQTPAGAGDYVGGINHVLPTGGSARWASGLGAADFVKRIYLSALDADALERLSPHVDALADTEGLYAQARTIWARQKGKGLF